VGLIGSPNAGKSTLLSVMSAARPKIADYPFTTLTPNLGVVDTGDYSFVAADIPGLIEGAHQGVGLGHEFLRHIRRTLVLLHVVDGNEEDPVATFQQVLAELGLYDESLLRKPQIVVANKMDLPDARARWPEFQEAFGALGYETMAISAITREGVDTLIFRAANLLREQVRERQDKPPESEDVPVISIKPKPDHFEVQRKRKTFHVTGEDVERLAIMTDTSSEEAMHRLQQRLRRMGVIQALVRAGATQGSKVRIGDVELRWDTSFEPEVRV
ncbi:MAG: Obg family GTPase CgtA, partial [Chloroflexota bacterium]